MTDFTELPRETVFTDLVKQLREHDVPAIVRMHFVPTSNETCKGWEITDTLLTVVHVAVGTVDYSFRTIVAALVDGEWRITYNERQGPPTIGETEVPQRLAPAALPPAPRLAPTGPVCPACRRPVPNGRAVRRSLHTRGN